MMGSGRLRAVNLSTRVNDQRLSPLSRENWLDRYNLIKFIAIVWMNVHGLASVGYRSILSTVRSSDRMVLCAIFICISFLMRQARP